jgi:DNA-directed RNA polymerase specialized sigma24 family protein
VLLEVDADASFDAAVRTRTVALLRMAYLLTGDHHLAEDLVQQALLRVVDRLSRICAAGDPDPYVCLVLHHEHIYAWRRSRPGAPIVDVSADHSARSAELCGYRPGGGQIELVRLPSDATWVEVTRDLLDHFDQFGWFRRRPHRRPY